MAAFPGPQWAELAEYLGERFCPEQMDHTDALVAAEFSERSGDEADFYRSSNAYLYDLTRFSESGTKEPYRALIRYLVGPGARLLDYGCGIGSDGLRFVAEGSDVSFADYDNPSTAYLRWRLARRRLSCPVYDVERLPADLRFDLVYSFDVLEHLEEPLTVLRRLEGLAPYVCVNLIYEDPDDRYPLHYAHDWQPLIDYV